MRELGGSAPPSPAPSPSGQRQRGSYQADVRKALDRKLRPKRFTFQSTLRQIERRRIAEKLSRDAELKEQQRLSELEAMRRVEEEFQRKRAREKANIRHQLRLFNLEEHNEAFSSLPVGLPADWHREGRRADPDGAPSPTSHSKMSADLKAPGVQVLSEYRQNQREYRDYRPSRLLDTSIDSAPSSAELNGVKRATVHPEAVFDIPKNTPVYVANHHHNSTPVSVLVESERGVSTPRSSSSDNYRRDFAHGTVPLGGRSLASSDSELSQPNTRPTSRQGPGPGPGHYRPLPHLQRSRSASPHGNNSSCDYSPPLSHQGSFRRSPVLSPEWNAEEDRPYTLKDDDNAANTDQFSERKRQRSPEGSPPCSPPHSPASSRPSSPAVNANFSVDSMDGGVNANEREQPAETNIVKMNNQSHSTSKAAFLGLQPFGANKNKGYRPISFNPPSTKLAPPVN